MKGTATTMVYMNDTENSGFAETSDELKTFGNSVKAGDYITVVYETPSNGGSWHRFGGSVVRTRDFQGRLDDLWIEVEDSDRDNAGELAHLHINTETGDYSFTDDVDSMEQWGIKKIAYTPE
jgi:hypothetical protein